jgi:flagellar biosynthesis/type III secretory pathway chaperone
MDWVHLDDLNDLRDASRLLKALESSLGRERRAVATLDAQALSCISEEKRAIAVELSMLGQRATHPGSVVVRNDSEQHTVLRREVRALVERVRAVAHANAALLRDAIDAVSDALGIEHSAATYDHRARRVDALRAFTGKAA